MDNHPLVSVIIPNYNHKSYLKQRIDSVLNQSFQDFEVLIFDDASSDGSLELLNTYKTHPKVSNFIVNLKNSGSPFAQWRKGIELARGNYIWIAETDDFAEPTFLEETISVMNSSESVALVYSDSKIVSNNGEHKGDWSTRKNTFFKTNRWSNNHSANGTNEIIDYLLYKVTINNASAVLFRKKQLLKMDLDFLVAFKNAGDLYAYCSVLIENKISYISQPLNNYREHQLNLTKSNMNSGLFYIDALRCYNEIFNNLLDKPLNELQKKKLDKAFKFIIRRFGFNLVDCGYRKDLERFIITNVKNKVVSRIDAFFFIIGFKLYSVNNTKLKDFIKHTLKKK